MVIGARTRERFGSILSDFLHGIKAKGYDVIGVHVFVPSLMRFLPKKGWFTEPYTTLRTLVLSFSTLHGRWIVNRVISIGLHGSTWFVISTLKYLAVWFILPSPCTAFSQSLSVNSFRWRIRGAWTTWPETLWPRGKMRPRDEASLCYCMFECP